MTTEVLSAAVRTSDGIVIPLGTRAEVLADLRQRRDVAEALAERAEAAGDLKKFEKVMARWHLRTLQIDWIERRPEDAKCWKCGELGGQMFALSVDCLEHRTPHLSDRAAVLAGRDSGETYGR